ncbi:MAG: hypothetical protein Q7U66_11280 [Methylobacter sp.]|nr:hypothetical protein [Methylobacter sp.]
MSRPLTKREQRAINALLNGAVMRENLDFIAGCSNSPELVAGLRRKGLSVPCERVERFDKDGNSCWPGRYSFTQEDRVLARELGA